MRKQNTELLGDVIRQVLHQQKLDKPLNEKRLIDAWPVVLGNSIMQYTRELSVRNRTLYVTMDSSVLRHDLFLSREKIVAALNKYVGAEVVSNIVFQ